MEIPQASGRYNVLLVAPDAGFRHRVERRLRHLGYLVLPSSGVAEAAQIAASMRLDLVLVSLTFEEPLRGELDDVGTCEPPHEPLAMIAFEEPSDPDGDEAGARHNLAKARLVDELVRIVRTRLTISGPRAIRDESPSLLWSGDLELDFDRQEVSRNGQVLPMKRQEFALLAFFAQNPGRVFSRQELLKQVWPPGSQRDPLTVSVHVHWLRQKIENDPTRPERLRSLYARGYVFR